MTREQIDQVVEEKVIKVADYVIDEINKGNNPSTRSVSKDLTSKGFRISNATVCVYLSDKLPRIDNNKYQLIKPLIDKNTPKSIENPNVLQRVYKVIDLVLEGYTIEQIVVELNRNISDEEKVTFDIIYDDIMNRFFRIEKDKERLESVKKQLLRNKMNNLNNQGNNGPNMDYINQPRDENGKFKSKK